MSDEFIAQAQALKDENERLREALAITSEALGKVKEIVDALLHPRPASNTPPVPPVVEQPQTDPNQYTVTEFGDDTPHEGPYKVDVSGYINKDGL
tara:strand:+ start:314 stop:598 length:285 start_codon:yes stop_codon:yes gene_type:complete